MKTLESGFAEWNYFCPAGADGCSAGRHKLQFSGGDGSCIEKNAE